MTTTLTVPLADRHFEGYVVGVVAEYGSYAVTEGEVVRFAESLDSHQRRSAGHRTLRRSV
jgi:hypothetical protein